MEAITCNTPLSTIYLRNLDVTTNQIESSEKPTIRTSFQILPDVAAVFVPSSPAASVNFILPKSHRISYLIIRNCPSNAHLMIPPMPSLRRHHLRAGYISSTECQYIIVQRDARILNLELVAMELILRLACRSRLRDSLFGTHTSQRTGLRSLLRGISQCKASQNGDISAWKSNTINYWRKAKKIENALTEER